MTADPTNLEWKTGLVNQLEMRGETLQSAGRPDAALASFQRVVEFSEQTPEGPRAFGEWATDYAQSLDRIEAIYRVMAEADRQAGRPEAAAQHEKLAAEAHAKLEALPK